MTEHELDDPLLDDDGAVSLRLPGGHVQVTRWARWHTDPLARSTGLRAALLASGQNTVSATAATVIADSVADPDSVTARLAAPLSVASTPVGDLIQLEATLYTSLLMPGPQPRGRSTISGGLEPVVDADEQGALHLRFTDLEAARAWCASTIRRTLPSATRRLEQIAGQGILRPLQVHPAVLVFEAEGSQVPVVVVRDGISRWLAAQVLLQELERSEPAVIATLITDLVLPTDLLTKSGTWQSRGRARINEARARYLASIAAGDGNPGWDAIRVRQALTTPAVITLGLAGADPTHHQAETALKSLAAQVHSDVQNWAVEDEILDVLDRAFTSLASAGGMDPRVADLALGTVACQEAPGIFGVDPMGDPALQRALLLARALHDPQVNTDLRRTIRSMTGLGSIRRSRWGQMIATILDEPWRTSKPLCVDTARRMWGHGGVLIPDLSRPWTPATADRYLDLVAPAVAGDHDARTTLAVAGGIALLADRILTTVTVAGTGSAGETRLPWHGSPATVMHRLAHGCGVEGLTVLAVAADHFDHRKTAVNSLGAIRAVEPANAGTQYYVLPDVDLAAVDLVARREDGTLRALTETRVMALTDDTPPPPETIGEPPSGAVPTAVPMPVRSIDTLRVDLLQASASLVSLWNALHETAAAQDRAPLTAVQHTAVTRALATVQAGVTLAATDDDRLGGLLG